MSERTYKLVDETLGRAVELTDIDAYAVAVRQGYPGTRDQWLQTLRPAVGTWQSLVRVSGSVEMVKPGREAIIVRPA